MLGKGLRENPDDRPFRGQIDLRDEVDPALEAHLDFSGEALR